MSARLAANLLLLSFAFFASFHLLVIAGVIPADIVWAGRIKTREDLLKFEAISLLILALFTLIVLLRKYAYHRIEAKFLRGLLRGAVWCMGILFLLNTVGNLFAVSDFERYVFTPVTALFALLSFRLALEKGDLRAA